MRIIEPITITDEMVGSGAGTVPEVEHPEWAGGSTYNELQKIIVKGTQGAFVDLVSGDKDWVGITIAPNGDVYASVITASIWIQAAGTTTFVDLGAEAGNKNWYGMCAAPNGDIYACVGGGSIWKRTGGTGSFADLVTGNKNWYDLCAAPNGDIYACVGAGSIWKQTGGAGSFDDLVAGNKEWRGMCAAPNGDIYACVYGGSIWKQTGGSGAFADLGALAGDKNWFAMAAAPNGDIYACVYGGSVWKQTGGAGSFEDLGSGNKNWRGLAVSPISDAYGVYGCVYGGSIWITTFEVVHKIYESLIGSNYKNYPPIDVRQTTPKWLEISATNKWKVFDGKVNDQMATASPAVYTITPGVAFNSVVLLNVEATSVTIAVDDPAYSQTVSTGATDIVKMDLAGDADSVLTITITNTAGLAKCGEIVIGNYYEIGTMKPLPVVGIVDYSVKTQDEWGDWTVVEREYSEKINAQINVAYGSVDAVVAKLKDYRATPIVWIGNSSYACTIIYGFWKDWSIPVATRGKAILSIEIMGVT